MNRHLAPRHDDLLHRVAVEGVDSPAVQPALAATCAEAVRGGVSATLIGILCDERAPRPARERALARIVALLPADGHGAPAADAAAAPLQEPAAHGRALVRPVHGS